MKELYICEKCGKTFTDCCAAYDCENSHLTPYEFCEFAPPVFSPGSAYPSEVTVTFCVSHWDDESQKYIRDYTQVTYKVKKVFSAAENGEVERQRLLNEERREREHEEWLARLAAEEAAKKEAEVEEERVGA